VDWVVLHELLERGGAVLEVLHRAVRALPFGLVGARGAPADVLLVALDVQPAELKAGRQVGLGL
jgi:hypothetical protein